MQNKNDIFTQKKIKSVTYTGQMLESLPEQYNLSINYTDGSKKTTNLYGKTIAEQYFNYLNEHDKNIFSRFCEDANSENDKDHTHRCC